MRRSVKVGLGAVLGVVLLLLMATASVSTHIGSRLLLSLLPGVTSIGFSGSILGAWGAQEVVWRQGDLVVTLTAPKLEWRASCLLRRVVCIDSLSMDELSIEVPVTQTQSREPFSLPELNLPVALELGEINIGSLKFGDTHIRQFQLVANGHGQTLYIERFVAAYQDYRINLKGQINTQGLWQTTLSAMIDMPPIDQTPWRISLGAYGPLAADMTVDAKGYGYLNAHLTGTVALLQEGFPAQLVLDSQAFKPSRALPDTLILNAVKLLGQGNLTDGYHLQGAAQLNGAEGKVAVALDGVVDSQGAQVKHLTLTDHSAQTAALTGAIDWLERLAIQAELATTAFAWRSVYPVDAAIDIQALSARIHYTDVATEGALEGSFIGPAGEFAVKTDVAGVGAKWHLQNLVVSAGEGELAGEVSFDSEQIGWQADLKVSKLDPAFWVKDLPGNLNGSIQTDGVWGDKPDWRAAIDVRGQLRGQPAQLLVQGNGQNAALLLPKLNLLVGDNRISGSIGYEKTLKGELTLALNRMHELWPGLAGTLRGTVQAAGTLDKPQGKAQISARAVRYQDISLTELGLNAALNAQQSLTLTLNAQGIVKGQNALGRLDVTGRGTLAQHQLTLKLDGPFASLHLDGSGSSQTEQWQGRLNTLALKMQTQDWALNQPTQLTYRFDPATLNVAAHCLNARTSNGIPASLCAGAQTLLPANNINYQLKGLDLASLSPWLPNNFNVQGILNGAVNIKQTANGPRGSIGLDAGSGVLKRAEQGRWHEYPYRALTLKAELNDKKIASELRFISAALGQISANIGIDPKGDKRLDGVVRLSGFELAVLEPFIAQVDDMGGQLNGEARIGGTLVNPRLDGNLRVRDGRASGADLPTVIEQLTLDVAINGAQARVTGNWRSGLGRATLQGQVDWQNRFAALLDVRTERLPIVVEPYANLETDAQLRLELADLRLAISGTVDIPRGEIIIRELPPSTVKLSPDAVIVGQDKAKDDSWQMAMDVDVTVGRDQLTFKGFGLTAELVGQVKIGDNLDTRGTLDLNKGRYRAYGQRLIIRRARMFFAGPIDQPYVDVEAVRKVDDVLAGIRLNGNVQHPSTTVFSEPAMSQEQALSYLVLGRPMSDGTGEDSNLLGQAALALGLAGSESFTGNIAGALGIEDFAIDTQGSGVTTSVVASGRITDKLSLRYGVGVFEPANTLALRYVLNRRLYVEAASGFASSIDVFYKRDY